MPKLYRLTGIGMLATLLVWQGIAPIRAQEGDGLSEEEIALVERMAQGSADIEALSGYSSTRTYVVHSNTRLSIPTEDGNVLDFDYLENTERYEEGRVVREDDVRSIQRIFSLTHSIDYPEDLFSYVLEGELIFLDNTLYVNAAYSESEGTVPDLTTGWQTFTTAEELPASFAQLQLDKFFEEDENPLANAELLLPNVSSAELSVETLEDGTEIEVITLVIGDEHFVDFWQAVNENDPSTFDKVIVAPNAETSATLIGHFAPTGEVIFFSFGIAVELLDEDASILESDNLPEGSTVSFNLSINQEGTFSDHNAELDPIVAPEIEATEEAETQSESE